MPSLLARPKPTRRFPRQRLTTTGLPRSIRRRSSVDRCWAQKACLRNSRCSFSKPRVGLPPGPSPRRRRPGAPGAWLTSRIRTAASSTRVQSRSVVVGFVELDSSAPPCGLADAHPDAGPGAGAGWWFHPSGFQGRGNPVNVQPWCWSRQQNDLSRLPALNRSLPSPCSSSCWVIPMPAS